jgi:hypothetical protein
MPDKRNPNTPPLANKKLDISRVKSNATLEGDATFSTSDAQKRSGALNGSPPLEYGNRKQFQRNPGIAGIAEGSSGKPFINTVKKRIDLVRPSGPFVTIDSDTTKLVSGEKSISANIEAYPLATPPEIFIEEGEPEADIAILVFVSDLHIGDGSASDDFSQLDDASFVQMIDWLYKIGSRYGRPIELVLLGDIL